MTCIIGVEHDGVVYMGADSISLNGWAKDIAAQRKIFRRDGLLFGYAGNPRGAQILQHLMVINEAHYQYKESDEAYLVKSVIEPARLAFREYGFTETENGRELGACFLLGYRGKLYSVENSFQLCRSSRPFYAIGAGDDFAMGALYAIFETINLWDTVFIKASITRALMAASRLSCAVEPPFVIETLADGSQDQQREPPIVEPPTINKEAFFRL